MIISKIRNFECVIEQEVIDRDNLRKRLEDGYVLTASEEAQLEDRYFVHRYLPAESKFNKEISDSENKRVERKDRW